MFNMAVLSVLLCVLMLAPGAHAHNSAMLVSGVAMPPPSGDPRNRPRPPEEDYQARVRRLKYEVGRAQSMQSNVLDPTIGALKTLHQTLQDLTASVEAVDKLVSTTETLFSRLLPWATFCAFWACIVGACWGYDILIFRQYAPWPRFWTSFLIAVHSARFICCNFVRLDFIHHTLFLLFVWMVNFLIGHYASSSLAVTVDELLMKVSEMYMTKLQVQVASVSETLTPTRKRKKLPAAPLAAKTSTRSARDRSPAARLAIHR